MRIALTVKGAGLGAWLDDDFADCMQVMIVNDQNGFESWLNPYRGGTTTEIFKLADKIIAEQIEVLITAAISQSIIKRFQDAGIQVVFNKDGSVLDRVEEVRHL
jgi:predicted Fe-Mo cluster-binding NifX family protein